MSKILIIQTAVGISTSFHGIGAYLLVFLVFQCESIVITCGKGVAIFEQKNLYIAYLDDFPFPALQLYYILYSFHYCKRKWLLLDASALCAAVSLQ